jgi:hypothetical protein
MSTVFKSNFSSCVFLLGNGKPIHFINGTYVTDNEGDIELLNAEIKQGHPHIRFPTEEEELQVRVLGEDPLSALRAAHFKEFLEAQRRAIDPNSDKGNYEAEKINPAGSSDIAQAAAGR